MAEVRWRKIGGGSLHIGGRRVDSGKTFMAEESALSPLVRKYYVERVEEPKSKPKPKPMKRGK